MKSKFLKKTFINEKPPVKENTYITNNFDICLYPLSDNKVEELKNTEFEYKFSDNEDTYIIYSDKEYKNLDNTIGIISIKRITNDIISINNLYLKNGYNNYKVFKIIVDLFISKPILYITRININNNVFKKFFLQYGFEIYSNSNNYYYFKLNRENMSLEESNINSKDIYPIFILNSWTNTLGGKVIRFYTRNKYTHSAISLDSSLKNLYSFNGDNKTNLLGGFSIESIDDYLKTYSNCLINLQCLFVGKKEFKIIKNLLNYMSKNQDKTTYSYINILNIFLHRSKKNEEETMSMVCSQFVSYVLLKANINIVNHKSINLVTPKDLVINTNPKVYKIYDGFAKNYNIEEINKNINFLKSSELVLFK